MFTVGDHKNRRVSHPISVFAAFLGLIAAPLLAIDNGAIYLRAPALLPVDVPELAAPREIPNATSTAERLRAIIDHHDGGKPDLAIAGWQHIDLPEETAVWRHLGLAGAHLHAGRLEAAKAELEIAQTHDSNDAAIHYFRGLLNMERADAVAGDAQDDHALRRCFEQKAIRELKLTLKFARSTYLSPTLVPINWVAQVPYPMTEPVVPPTAGALLRALGADNYVGKAHGLLAHLYLTQEDSAQAEHHIEEASAHGIPVVYGYRWLGALYEEQGRSMDADRAYTKAMQGGDLLARPGMTPHEALDRAFATLL